MLAGCKNLAKHIDTVQQFGLPYIVAINEFATDTPAEGIGEKLTRLPDMPFCHILIAKPPVNVSTKLVYENLPFIISQKASPDGESHRQE